MLKFIDQFLNRITMYRLVLYYVSGLWVIAFIFSLLHILPHAPFDLLVSAIIIHAVGFLVNAIFARIFQVPSNLESVYTTGFILALIISPAQPFSRLLFLGLAATLAMASKYIIAINKKHLFNPAAFAIASAAIVAGQSANWWVGNLYMAPFVLLGGFLMVKKLRRWDLVLSFFVVAIAVISTSFFLKKSDMMLILKEVLFYSPMFFFACVMLTEPMTTPPSRNLRIIYGALTGFLFAPFMHLGSIYSTPELALLAGNIFVYIVSPKYKLILELKEKVLIAPDVYDFLFKQDKKMVFKPGQYMEWTLGHEDQDSRGMRRYFTIASSPAEEYLRMGVKFYPNASSFKKSILHLEPGDKIIASQLAGDFVLPSNKDKKLVFIAGGIGITPFRSMVKDLLDRKEKRDIILIYSNYRPVDIVYRDVLDQAERELGIKTIYTVTDLASCPDDWPCERGFIDEQKIMRLIPDYKERTFYLSGSHSMVVAFDENLRKIGIKKMQIKKDFFPGFV
ncbi:MAG TPA: RnfABCDGE type electron transport complex subunit D [Candidatus Udaeobacter sp.]|nr:RnfABCDGE type electron transport complex subunit D [Candidatus Udaeobacter sp.]